MKKPWGQVGMLAVSLLATGVQEPARALDEPVLLHRALLDTVLAGDLDRVANDAVTRRNAFSLWTGAFVIHEGTPCRASQSEYNQAPDFFLQDYREKTGGTPAGALEFELPTTLPNIAKGRFGQAAANPAKTPDWAVVQERSRYFYRVLNGCEDPRAEILRRHFMQLFRERAREPIAGGPLEGRIEAARARAAERADRLQRFTLDPTQAAALGIDVDALQPVVQIPPAFPERLLLRGVTKGSVSVAFGISPDGLVVDARAADGDQAFARAATRAVSRWKYRLTVVNSKLHALTGVVRVVTFDATP